MKPEELGVYYESILDKDARKEGGVYYTPQYIVDYIVENTVGEFLKNRTPEEVAKIRIVDPACGAGVFLVGAYQYLLDWHEKHIGKLTLAKRRRILSDSIFGVDIDPLAVEITKYCLAMQCTEGKDLSLELDKNICVGNSLVETKFHWQKSFPYIFKQGGFDIVIGNPPYGGALLSRERKYLSSHFNVGTTDTAASFLLQARKLAHSDGKVGFIVPKALTYAPNWQKVREVVLPDITNIVDCGKVWNDVKLEMSICVLQQNNNKKTFVHAKRNTENVIETFGTQCRSLCTEFGLILNGLTKQEIEIGLKIKRNSKTLNDFVENQRGAMLQRDVSNKGNLSVLGGKQISRYYLEKEKVKGKIFTKYVTDKRAWVYNNSVLVQNIVAHIARPSPHILITVCPSSELENLENFILLDTINQLTMKGQYESKFVSALLNSFLLSWYVYRFVFAHAIRTMHFDRTTTAKIPVPDIDCFTREDKTKHNKIVRLVDSILELKRKERDVREMRNRDVFRRQIKTINHEIDMLIYQLYGLTDNEIAIIEGVSQEHEAGKPLRKRNLSQCAPPLQKK